MYSIRKNNQTTRRKSNLDLEPTREEILNVVINDLGFSKIDFIYYSRDPDYADVFHSAEQIATRRKIEFAKRKEELTC